MIFHSVMQKRLLSTTKLNQSSQLKTIVSFSTLFSANSPIKIFCVEVFAKTKDEFKFEEKKANLQALITLSKSSNEEEKETKDDDVAD
jgi:hypothetical protein